MISYIIRRLFFAVITIFIAFTLVFVVMRNIPGGPFDVENIMSEEARANLNKLYGLDQPVLQQYGNYIKAAFQGDFGSSYKYRGLSVKDIIIKRFPITVILSLSSIICISFFGITFGIAAATKRNTTVDYIIMFFASLGYAVPNFVVALLLMLVLAIKIPVLPVAGWGSIKNIILPTIALSLPNICIITRLTRSAMINIFQEDYIRTAFSKGLKSRQVTLKHALQNALIPIITILGIIFSNLLCGSIVIERVFAIPGVGNFFANSIKDSDYPVVMGLTILFSFILVVMNLLVDLIYGFIDPRVTYD